MRTSLITSLCLFGLRTATAQYTADSTAATIRELEHLYLDSATSGFLSAITPCTNYANPQGSGANNNLGRQTAAEWIRTAFHDFVTGNIYTSSGGLDASIGFETTRDENVGVAFNDALTFFSYFFSSKVSMSDLIALGVATAAGNCGGTKVTMRGGRIDATAAGPTGVPKPETNLEDTLTDFSNAGFNQDDTIALTVCGHSMGGVHGNTFPQVTGTGAESSMNADGRVPFDETVGGFDPKVATDYVNWTGDKGGPLVTTANKTVQSDLRLYSSDNNATIDRFASGGQTYFQQQCSSLFQRMIETVPSNVRFTTPINPTTTTNLKPYGIYLSVDWKGNMVLSGNFRYVQVSGAPAAPASLTITLINRAGKTTSTTTTATKSAKDTGTGIWGPTNSYTFSITFPATVGVSGVTAGGQTFAFQDKMFVVPSLSNVSPAPMTFSTTTAMNTVMSFSVNSTVAYLYSGTAPASLTATYAIPKAQTGSVAPVIDTSLTVTLNLMGKTGPYAIYSAITKKSMSQTQAYSTSVDVAVAGQSAGVVFFKPFNRGA
ncbi:hypothetical protein MMC21_001973 [Puttea exsequens]|nr:hypothetical protein [Puttea exsequens]